MKILWRMLRREVMYFSEVHHSKQCVIHHRKYIGVLTVSRKGKAVPEDQERAASTARPSLTLLKRKVSDSLFIKSTVSKMKLTVFCDHRGKNDKG